MKNFKNAGFAIEDIFGKKAVVILLSACTVKELDKFFVCSKMNPADFTRLLENLRLYTTEDTKDKVDELEKMYPTTTESTPDTTTTEDTTETTTTTTTEESAPTPTYTYRELQAQVKALKEAGLIPSTVKLNAKREVLEAAIAQAQAQAPAETTTDTTPTPMPAPEAETTETTEDTYYKINFNSKGMQAVIADLGEMYLEAVITKALGRPTKKLIADFDLDPSLKRSEVKAILTDAITAVAAYYQNTMEDDEEPTESAPVEEAPAPTEESATVAETETTLEVVEVKEVTPVVAPRKSIPEGYAWKYVKYSWDGTKEEAIDFALEDIQTMGMSFDTAASLEEWVLAQVANCACLATLQSRLEGVAWDMMVLYPGYRGAVTNWLESHKCPVRNDARKDVNYMMSQIWKNTILPDFQEAYPEAWAAVTEEA